MINIYKELEEKNELQFENNSKYIIFQINEKTTDESCKNLIAQMKQEDKEDSWYGMTICNGMAFENMIKTNSINIQMLPVFGLQNKYDLKWLKSKEDTIAQAIKEIDYYDLKVV